MIRTLRFTLAVIAVFGLLAAAANAEIITSVVRSNGTSGDRDPIGVFDGNTQPLATEAGNLQDGNTVFSDRTYPWANTPAELVGAEYIRTFNTDKGGTGSDTVTYTVTTSQAALVAVTIDDRWLDEDEIPLQQKADEIVASWAPAGTFADTGLDLYIREREDGTRDRPMSVFAAGLPAGTYVFGPLPSNKNFYSIGAIPEPSTLVLLAVCGTLGLGLWFRRR